MQKAETTRPPRSEVCALVRECYAIDGLPDYGVFQWMPTQGLSVEAHARIGAVMGLPQEAPLPAWARRAGVPWPQAGLRLVAPLCDTNGQMQSVVAQSVTGGVTAVPSGYSTRGLVVACPTARRALAGGEQPERIFIADNFVTWMRWVERAQTKQRIAVWGVLADSWTDALVDKIAPKTRVFLVRDACAQESARSIETANVLRHRVANGDIEISKWPPVGRTA